VLGMYSQIKSSQINSIRFEPSEVISSHFKSFQIKYSRVKSSQVKSSRKWPHKDQTKKNHGRGSEDWCVMCSGIYLQDKYKKVRQGIRAQKMTSVLRQLLTSDVGCLTSAVGC